MALGLKDLNRKKRPKNDRPKDSKDPEQLVSTKDQALRPWQNFESSTNNVRTASAQMALMQARNKQDLSESELLPNEVRPGKQSFQSRSPLVEEFPTWEKRRGLLGLLSYLWRS